MEAQDDTPGRLALRRLSPALGAEVIGFDSGLVDKPAVGEFLQRALRDYQLLLIRGMDLDPSSFRRIALRLGPLRPVPGGMQREPGMPDVQRFGKDAYAVHWHADGTASPIPSPYTLLYALRVPDAGGETSFADMYAACAALSPARRRALSGRVAIHNPDIARHFRHGTPIAPAGASLRYGLRMRLRFLGRMLSPRTTRHPVIRVHEETGRSSLFLGDHAWRVTRCWWPSGARLVNELNTFATTRPEWIYKHAWRAGDLIIWDNRCLLHRADEYDEARHERVMLRAVVKGVNEITFSCPRDFAR